LSSFEKVKNWLNDSGLVITDTKNENCGAVHSYYDVGKNEYGFLYPEITGYYISTLRFLYELEKNEKYLTYAKHSADWLIQIYKKYGAIIQGLSTDSSKQQISYSFDTAICAKGLLDCFSLTRDEKYLEFGKKMICWIIDGALENDGTIMPYKDLNSNKFRESKDLWYNQKGCLHIKIAIPLLLLHQLTKENALLDKAVKICDTYTRFQNPDGSISIHDKSKTVNLHTLCYALEGLLYAFDYSKNSEYLKSCKKALDWCLKKIESDRSIELWFGSRYKSKPSYAIAQLIRLMILIDRFNNTESYKNQIDSLHSFLISLQANHNDPKINGGFYEDLYKVVIGWKKRPRLNSWGSMFALQALYWYQNYENLSFENSIKYIF